MHGCRSVFFALSFFLTVGCTSFQPEHHSAKPSFLRGNNSEIREYLLRKITIGTLSEDAENLAKSLGLELSPRPDLGSEASRAIECRYTGQKGLFGQNIWLIQIDCPDGKVSDIFCEQIASR